MTRAIVTVTADNADVWRSDAGLVIAGKPDGPVMLLTGDADDLRWLICRLDEALIGDPSEPTWAKAWSALLCEYRELGDRLT